jgi:predicted lysophospholipase L1 biosynthesis ABC-type transport system permease subunit
MAHALSLYARYALRSFIRGRSRSLFGAFCVAVGVASVVALGLVAGNFRDAVTGNAQKLNRGDVSLAIPESRLSLKDSAYFAQLKARGDIVDYTPELRVDALLKAHGGNQTNVVIGSAIAVEAQKFPFYDTITANDPSGTPLRRLLRTASAGSHGAAISQTVLNNLHLHLGSLIDIVFRYGGKRTYVVTGVVPDNAPDPGFGGGLFPYFAMVDRPTMAAYIKANDNAASSIYMTTRNAAQAAVVKREIEQHFGGLASPKTIADVEKDSVNGADGFDKFFAVMSLIAVVIGGIGIVNTMLVAARRRRSEIAILKSLGMKGRQVIMAFLFESTVLAIAGTAVGLLLGIAASSLVNNVTQNLAGYPIPWSLHTRPLLAGLLVGVVATVLFSYLPIVRASRIRPIAALRGDEPRFVRHRRVRAFLRHPLASTWRGIKAAPMGLIRLPRRPGFRTGLLVLLLAVVMGYLAVLYTGLFSGADTVIRGAIAGLATLVIAGVLIQVFVFLVWLISKLPTFGRLSVRMAFRSMSTQKRRLGSTLLALCIGILAVGSIAILAQNLKSFLASSLEAHQNFNVGVEVPHNSAAHAQLLAAIGKLPGIQNRDDGAIANIATLYRVDGVGTQTLINRDLAARDAKGNHTFNKDDITSALQTIRGVAGHDVRTASDNYVMYKGRNLNASDAGTDHVLVSQDFSRVFHINVGSHLIYADGALRVPATVVGIASSNNFIVFAENVLDVRYMQKTGLSAPSSSHYELMFLKINHSNLDADVTSLRKSISSALVLDLSSFLEFTQIVDKLALFPEIIGGLVLFAGAIIIANTVALAMLERRREIGIMKAVGAKRRTILQFLLVENAIVGFVGAGVGVLLAMLASALFAQNLLQISPSFDWTTIIVLILIGMALAIGASSLTALPASSEKPMSVLRYE